MDSMTVVRRKGWNSDIIFDIVGIVILVISTIVSIYPLIWMMLGSFKENQEIFLNTLALPREWNFGIFSEVWNRANYGTASKNSILNLVGTNAIVLVTASMAAFSLARIKFIGRTVVNAALSSSIVISGQLILIPLFFVVKNLNIYNTLWATIIADAAMDLPICTILFMTFFKEIPYEIEESSMLDGCTKSGFFIRFIVPLSKPIISTIVIFVSLWTWNEYLFALTFLKDDAVRTIPLQLQNFRGRFAVEYNAIFAALSMAIIPLIILYILMQKSFVKGLTAGAVKM